MKGNGRSNIWQRSSVKGLMIVAAVSCVLLGAVRCTRCASKRRLAEEAGDLSSELLDFSNARAQLSRIKASESFQSYRNRAAADDAETQSIYHKLYYGRVAAVREKFASRGSSDRDLDAFYQRPEDPLAIRDISERLLSMGSTLQNP